MSTKNPIPYVCGIALSQAQVDAVAKVSLSEEEIAISGTTHCAIIDQMERQNLKTTLVPFVLKRERHYNYLPIAVVVPSFNGTNPKMTVPKRIFDGFRRTYGRGPNNELDNLYGTSFRWPLCYAEPDWLYCRMRETEYYWRHCYERREPQTMRDAIQGVKSSTAA